MGTLIIGIILGVIVCFALLAAIGALIDAREPAEPEVMVQLHALRRRRELDEFKTETKADARRLRYQLRQELRLLDDEE